MKKQILLYFCENFFYKSELFFYYLFYSIAFSKFIFPRKMWSSILKTESSADTPLISSKNDEWQKNYSRRFSCYP